MERKQITLGHKKPTIPIRIIQPDEMDMLLSSTQRVWYLLIGPPDWEMVGYMFSFLAADYNKMIIQFPRNVNWAQILAALRICPSKGAAYKYWVKERKYPLEVKDGYHFFSGIGPGRVRFEVWKPSSAGN